jgi:hypothetical protein
MFLPIGRLTIVSTSRVSFTTTSLKIDGYYIAQHNTAVAGRTFQQLLGGFSNEIGKTFSGGTTNIYAYMCGHNDIIGGIPTSGIISDTIKTGMVARTLGYKVIVFTDLRTTAFSNTNIDTVNAYIRTHYTDFADAMVDSSSIINETDTSLLADGIHPTAAACILIANLAKPIFKSFLTL